MAFAEYVAEINRHCEDAIINQTHNGNELYLTVFSDKSAAVTTLLYQHFNLPLVAMFANDERPLGNSFVLFYVFADRAAGQHIIIKAPIREGAEIFQSVTAKIPAANLYEREIHDLFGLTPQGHPDLRRMIFHTNWPENFHPLRKETDGRKQPPMANHPVDFIHVSGKGVYEIPVGPVHAGIIEPGHFRFSVAGEPIINLEAQLYYVHKGLEKLAETMPVERCLYLAERISGDESFANSLAYCQAIEKIAGLAIPGRARFARVIFAEMERLVSHLGDLAGVCVDVAFGFAAFQFRLLRGWTYQMIEEISNTRFLRSVNRPGGLRREFITGKEAAIGAYLDRIETELVATERILKSSSWFSDRVEHTGVLTTKVARDLNAVGPAARAAGIATDLRQEFPYAAYQELHLEIPDHQNGDVNCRVNVKLEECYQAISLIRQALDRIPAGAIYEPIGQLEAYRSALGYSEAPRGENIHWIMIGEKNTVYRYKIRTPSFCNWPVLCHAVKGNIVPDFPVINKSFNLSYAGNDL
jgi:Ni,Fe-hydrogenase III large subunit/Ni,Fe-hydrogenase III component G